ncbi:FBD-associated F-box protein [Melia azedarach]|uniref:FBD-associated F-box protein n=1 Tax=Melia azedarach TaxID=155640 RepID=A0ACC1WYF9_MELAZ|nr:FBD-associated F-box protein [Melia azedarach]
MSESQPAKKRIKRQHDQHHLITANLPDDILEIIFSFLPIKEALRTGLLSPRFRNCWIRSRKLHFDKDFARGRSQENFITIVDKIFNVHAAPTILSLRLYFNPTGVVSIVEEWIKKCVEKGVEELDLNFVEGPNPFVIYSSYLNTNSLKILKLCHCKVFVPPKLCYLNTLVLKKVHVRPVLMKTFLENCLLLESLDISKCHTMAHMKIYAENLNKFKELRVGDCGPYTVVIDIDAPTLRLFHYSGQPVFVKFMHKLMLNDVIVNFFSFSYMRKENPVNLNDLSNVTVFSATAAFLEILVSKKGNKEFHEKPPGIRLMQLKEFQLIMEGAHFCNVYDIASFLKSCPRLEKVFIDLNEFSFACGYYWESHQKEILDKEVPGAAFECVKVVKITGFKFQKHEVELVKYVVQKARFLKNLVLVTPRNSRLNDYAEELQHYYKMFCCWKASIIGQITVFDYFEDTSSVHPQHSRLTWF